MELTVIYTRFYHVLLSFIKSKINNEQDAEDILQNVFIKIFSNIDSVTNKDKLQSWIYTITRNAIIDYYRASNKMKTTSLEDDLAERFTDEEYNDTTKGLECCLSDFIHELPDEYRDIIIDVEIKNIKQKDLVEKYGLAYSSIRSRVQRGRERVKGFLLQCCDIKWDNRGNILEVEPIKNCSPSKLKSC
jgi:RNA polymerase sigma-70 factor, ECF subfamily